VAARLSLLLPVQTVVLFAGKQEHEALTRYGCN